FELTEAMAVQHPKPVARKPLPPATPAEIMSLGNMSSDSLLLEETIQPPSSDSADMLATVNIEDLEMEGLAIQPGGPPTHAATLREASALQQPETISYDE